MLRVSISRILIWGGALLIVLAVGLVGFDALSTWQHQVGAPTNDVVSAEEGLQAVGEVPPALDGAADDAPAATAPALPTPLEPPATPQPTVPEPAPTATPLPTAVATPAPAAATVEPTSAPTPAPTEEPQAEEPVSYGPAVRMAIPRIKVNERVMEVGVENGEYVAPAWDIGHQEDSVNPGEPGNSVFNGHLTTINAGRVFARLHELQPGDVIYVFTETHRLTWTVEEVFSTSNDDSSFIQPTDDTRITLYTCDGHLIPLAHDYSERLVVVGRLQEARARGG